MAKWVNKNIKWIFTAPTIIFILLCVTYPILYTLQLSFCEWGDVGQYSEKVCWPAELYRDFQ